MTKEARASRWVVGSRSPDASSLASSDAVDHSPVTFYQPPTLTAQAARVLASIATRVTVHPFTVVAEQDETDGH